MQTWNSSQSEQVHYTDAAAGASNDRGRSSALWFTTRICSKKNLDFLEKSVIARESQGCSNIICRVPRRKH